MRQLRFGPYKPEIERFGELNNPKKNKGFNFLF